MFYAQAYKSNWWSYIAKRVLIIVVAFIVISLAIFLPTQAVFAGNPVLYYWYAQGSPGWVITEEQIDEITEMLKETYYLNEPIVVQYFLYIRDIFTGNFPPSLGSLTISNSK